MANITGPVRRLEGNEHREICEALRKLSAKRSCKNPSSVRARQEHRRRRRMAATSTTSPAKCVGCAHTKRFSTNESGQRFFNVSGDLDVGEAGAAASSVATDGLGVHREL